MRIRSDRQTYAGELRLRLLAEQAATVLDGKVQLGALSTPEGIAAEDQVPLLHEQLVAISRTSRNRQKLAAIQASLERLARGEYGICENCEEQIPQNRLRAVPWATYCVACQDLMEDSGSVPETTLAETA